jgi:hypothetical protein
MKRQWQVRRQWTETLDGLSRWDRAYQYLLRWGSDAGSEQAHFAGSIDHSAEEVDDERGGVRAGVDSASGTDTKH